MMHHSTSCSRAQLLQQINEVSFAVDDLLLYLDTHPCCEKGMALYREYAEKRKKLMKEYAECYGPLTIDNALETNADTWKWMEQPFPWEREGGCKICFADTVCRKPIAYHSDRGPDRLWRPWLSDMGGHLYIPP